MKRYRVYISHGYAGCPDEERIINFPDDKSDEEIEKECKDILENLFENLDAGWDEITD